MKTDTRLNLMKKLVGLGLDPGPPSIIVVLRGAGWEEGNILRPALPRIEFAKNGPFRAFIQYSLPLLSCSSRNWRARPAF